MVSDGVVADVDEAGDDDKLHAWNHNSRFLGVIISQDSFSFRGWTRGWEKDGSVLLGGPGVQQGRDCDPTDPRQPVLDFAENQFSSSGSQARLCTAVHPTLGVGEMGSRLANETKNGPTVVSVDHSVERAIVCIPKVEV